MLLVAQCLLGLREEPGKKIVVTHLLEGTHRVAADEELEHFLEQTRRRNVLQQVAQMVDGCLGGRFDVETQLGGKAYCPQHAHRILTVTGFGVAQQAQQARLQIRHAGAVVDDREIGDIVVEGIDGEVAAQGILLYGAVEVVVQHHAVGALLRLAEIGATEGGHLDDLASEPHVSEAKAPSDEAAVAEHRFHLLRRGVGGHVEVLGLPSEQQVANATAHQVGLVAALLQAVEHFQGTFGNVGP